MQNPHFRLERREPIGLPPLKYSCLGFRNRPLCKVPSYGKLGADESVDCLVRRSFDALVFFSYLQLLQELDQRFRSPELPDGGVGILQLGERLFLHCEVGFHVLMRGGRALVTEP